jgi:HlyD family secretion protein
VEDTGQAPIQRTLADMTSGTYRPVMKSPRKQTGVWLHPGAISLGFTLVGLLLSGCNKKTGAPEAVGTLEMVEVGVGPLQPSRAARILVDEGDVVRAGDTLAVFALPSLAASEDQALARANAARQAERELSAGARPAEISKAEAELQAAQAEADRTSADLARLEPLGAQGNISRAQLDAARAAARTAASRRDAARSALQLLREGARPERRAAAAQEARSADAAAAMIRATARDLVLISPVDGVITNRLAEPGEVLAAGQNALTIGQPTRPWARIFVSQEALLSIKTGDTLSARLDGDSGVYRGRVSAIAPRAEYTPRVALTDQERADLLFGVKLEFSDTSGRLKAGLPITVTLPARTP